MRLYSIASGSSGNCIYVGDDNTHLLIDAGCSRKKIVAGLNGIGLTLRDIDAVFITHEHSDHVGGLRVLLKNTDIDVYATAGTFNGIRDGATKDVMIDHGMNIVRADEPVMIRNLRVDPYHISHDVLEPVCYKVTGSAGSVAVATDLGCFDDYLTDRLAGVDVLLLEANHDIRMLQTGPYPYPLKRRILGDRGHLSNDAAGEFLIRLLHDNLKQVILGHLSAENNLPELAYETVRVGIEMDEACPYHASDFKICVANRLEPTMAVSF